MQIGVKPGQRGWSYEDLRHAWMLAEAAGFDLVSTHDHVCSPAGLACWDGPTLLTAIAATTQDIAVGIHVVNCSLRHPYLLAAQLAVAQAASKKRLWVGLGAGSSEVSRHDHERLGIDFPPMTERLDRLDMCCQTFPRLWKGEAVTEATVGLNEASLGPIGITTPKIMVGGVSDRTIEIAARHADGWIHFDPDPVSWGKAADRVRAAAQRIGRTRPLRLAAQVSDPERLPMKPKKLAKAFEENRCDLLLFCLREQRNPTAVARLAEQLW